MKQHGDEELGVQWRVGWIDDEWDEEGMKMHEAKSGENQVWLGGGGCTKMSKVAQNGLKYILLVEFFVIWWNFWNWKNFVRAHKQTNNHTH